MGPAVPPRRIELRIDVTGSVKLPGKIEIAATAFLPDPATLGPHPIAMFASPGGGYSRGYFDMSFPGHQNYSQAQHHAARGLIFIAYDHLGVGKSTVVAMETMRIEDIAAANDAAVRKILAQVRKGALTTDYPAVPKATPIGIGQSMGGGVSIIMQGRHRTFAGLAPLGYSAIHTVLPQKSEADRRKGIEGHGRTAGRSGDPTKLSLLESSQSTVDYTYPFHWEDVPKDILNADMAGGYPIRKTAPPWGSTTIPNCVIAMMSPGFVAEEAAAVDVPVLTAMGERDVVPTPLSEPGAFKKATDVGVFIVPRMAHMHNFAGTRQLLWERLVAWAQMVAQET